MGVADVLKVFREGGELTTLEVAAKVDYSERAVKKAINRLLKDVSEHLEFRLLTSDEKEEKYGKKLGCRIRVYWLDE